MGNHNLRREKRESKQEKEGKIEGIERDCEDFNYDDSNYVYIRLCNYFNLDIMLILLSTNVPVNT